MLDFSQHKVVIAGWNFETLLRMVCQCRVAEIRDAHRAESFTAPADEPVVEGIEIVPS